MADPRESYALYPQYQPSCYGQPLDVSQMSRGQSPHIVVPEAHLFNSLYQRSFGAQLPTYQILYPNQGLQVQYPQLPRPVYTLSFVVKNASQFQSSQPTPVTADLHQGQPSSLTAQATGSPPRGSEDKSTQTMIPLHNHLCSCKSDQVTTSGPAPPPSLPAKPEAPEQEDDSMSEDISESGFKPNPGHALPELSENDWTRSKTDGAAQPIRYKLTKLCSLIQTLFIKGDIARAEYETLSLFEKRLLYYLVKRKFVPKSLKHLESDDNTCSFEKLQRIYSTRLPRRPEECYKFVLTRVLKHLRRKFEAEEGCSNPEARVNEVYFQPVSERYRIPMSDFSYPLAGNHKGKFHFNFVYFSKIFKSEPFLERIHEYTKEDIFADFQRDLMKKVAALVHKWERTLSNDLAFLDYAQMSILRYVIFNKRCKLPWTQVDVQNAIERVKDLIQICSEGKSNVGGHLIRNANKQRNDAH